MKTYQVWSDETDGSITVFEAGSKHKKLLPDESTLVYEIEAATWEEGQAIHHLRMGYEPYKPHGGASKCPSCDAIYYPEGSGECWKCNNVPANRDT